MYNGEIQEDLNDFVRVLKSMNNFRQKYFQIVRFSAYNTGYSMGFLDIFLYV